MVAAGFAGAGFPAAGVGRPGAPGRAGGGGRDGPLPFPACSSFLSKSSQVESLVPRMPEARSAKSSGFDDCRMASSYVMTFCR